MHTIFIFTDIHPRKRKILIAQTNNIDFTDLNIQFFSQFKSFISKWRVLPSPLRFLSVLEFLELGNILHQWYYE